MHKKPVVPGQYLVAFILISILFFLWAFLHNSNPILIPHLKKACQLSDTQSSFIDTAVYLGYFTIALPAGWFMHRFGYKKGILFGLTLFAAGAFMFYPAASARSYSFFLFALFVFAAGATFLETAGNPFAASMGNSATSEQRLNLAQSFNGVGAMIAPIIGSEFILSGIEHSKEQLAAMTPEQLNAYLQTEADTVKVPYLIMGAAVLLVGLLIAITRFPEIKDEENSESQKSFSLKVFRHRHVTWSIIAQLFYVGAQVCVGSFFVRYSDQLMNLPEKTAGKLWGLIAMGGFMAGRFVGTFLMKYIKASTLLAVYSLVNIALLAIGLFAEGSVAVYSIVAVPFFMSIMFPTIFALGIKDLNSDETKIASSFLIMSIVGGAIFPVFMGLISDATGSIQNAYIIPLLCFFVTFYFGWRGYKIKTVQNVSS
jgi:FHS family L-fucose permease-like MFS transporter